MALKGNATSGWVAHNFATQATADTNGYSIFCWIRSSSSAGNAVVVWGGGNFIHSALYITGDPFFQFDDVDNSLADFGCVSGVAPTGAWQPVLISKLSQTAANLYWTNMQNVAARGAGTLTAQNLTDLYVGEDETIGTFMQTNVAVAEVAIYNRAIGVADGAFLMSGANPLSISGCIAYYPLRSDLRDYGPNGNSLIGVAPVFTDHPPVQGMPDA